MPLCLELASWPRGAFEQSPGDRDRRFPAKDGQGGRQLGIMLPRASVPQRGNAGYPKRNTIVTKQAICGTRSKCLYFRGNYRLHSEHVSLTARAFKPWISELVEV